jgi:predicted phosphate transport protein (TIGR00153 family)
MDSFLQFLVPKERKFFALFKQQGEFVLAAAKLLAELVRESDEEKQKLLYREIKIVETKGDTVAATIYDELNRSFVTPFDRDDIQSLTSYIDSFIDLINDTGKKIVLYQPCPITEHMVQLADLVAKDAELLCDILGNLSSIRKNIQGVLEQCKQIKVIEKECDDLYEISTVDLFANVANPVTLMKQREIVTTLEETTDRAQDVGNIIRRIIVKFA